MEKISRRFFLAGATLMPALLQARAEAAQSGEAQPLAEAIPLEELDTPALILDADAFESNIAIMQQHLSKSGVGLRPHAKTHKCAEIAKRQLAAGAVGICCAKVSEAEALAKAGIGPILVTSPVTTRQKAARFVKLAKANPERMMVLDSVLGMELLSREAAEAGTSAKVLIDLDVGTRRTGVACGETALAFAKQVAASPNLLVAGVQAYAGHLMHVKGWETRRERSLQAMQAAVDTRTLLENAGIACPIFSGGGTGTFDIDTAVPGFSDMQCGSYIFMDVQYRIIGGPAGDLLDTFAQSLFVWSTAISQPAPQRITFDAGYKALSNENVAPTLADFPDARYDWGGDEHGIVQYDGETPPVPLGGKIRIAVAHCDPTVNLYDVYHVVRGGVVREIWPVTARGCSQ